MIPWHELATFAGTLRTAIEAGIHVPQAVEMAGRRSPHSALVEASQTAAGLTAAGESLADALAPSAAWFPPFFLAVIRSGEESGRLLESLAYLENHCRQLVRPTQQAKTACLAPLAILLAGCFVRLGLIASLASALDALAFAARSARDLALMMAAAALAWYVPMGRRAVREILILLPSVGTVIRSLSLNRFFHIVNMLYCTSSARVESMIRLASLAVTTDSLRNDLLRSATAIAQGATVGEAFGCVRSLSVDVRGTIIAGDEAGRLEQAFDTLERQTAEQVEHSLRMLNQILPRVAYALALMSITSTALSLAYTVAK